MYGSQGIVKEDGRRYAYLVMVTPENNNKFYEMTDLGDGTFEAAAGRIEKTRQLYSYSIHQWESKYNEKVRKGYQDMTQLRAVPAAAANGNGNGSDGVSEVQDPDVRGLMQRLLSYAKRTIAANYRMEVRDVTQAQVDAAQQILNELAYKSVTYPQEINNLLLRLYAIIPREMHPVGNYLLQPQGNRPVSDFSWLLTREQDILDALAQRVSAQQSPVVQVAQGRSILEQMGLKVRPGLPADFDIVRGMMQDQTRRLQTVFRVMNEATEERFNKGLAGAADKTTALYWHGSRNENWLSILEKGLMIRPTGVVLTGAMFGNGIYVADKVQKSMGYTSLRNSYWARGDSDRAVLAVMNTHLGRPLRIRHHESWCYDLDSRKLRARGDYDSLFAEGGADLRNNEIIVYEPWKVTVAYIVEVS